MEFGLMFNGQRGQVSVGRQIARGAEVPEQLKQDGSMPPPRMHHQDLRSLKPFYNVFTRGVDRERIA